MTQSNSPGAPGSNVVPMQGGWGQQPWLRPAPQPPGCFSALYGLNQCYDDIIMMQQILTKVICDMAANNKDFQACLVAGIAASGSNVPLIGVTNGSNAQPGQVGEYVQFNLAGEFGTPTVAGSFTLGVLQPGDWDLWGSLTFGTFVTSMQVNLNPIPAGFTNAMAAYIFSTGIENSLILQNCRASITVPSLMAFDMAGVTTAVGPFTLQVGARRRR